MCCNLSYVVKKIIGYLNALKLCHFISLGEKPYEQNDEKMIIW